MSEQALEGKFDGIDTMPLFDMGPEPRPEPEPVSPDRRRTIRQAEAIAAGKHPLVLALAGVVRHPDTKGRTYTRDDAKGRPLTCGTCVFRVLEQAGARTWPKCHAEGGSRVTSGPGSDVRTYWPACTKWTAR